MGWIVYYVRYRVDKARQVSVTTIDCMIVQLWPPFILACLLYWSLPFLSLFIVSLALLIVIPL